MRLLSLVTWLTMPSMKTSLWGAMSWGGILLIVGGSGGIPGSSEQVETRMRLVLLALFAGPSVAGLLTVRLVAGRVGLRDLFSRLLVRARCECRDPLGHRQSTCPVRFADGRVKQRIGQAANPDSLTLIDLRPRCSARGTRPSTRISCA